MLISPQSDREFSTGVTATGVGPVLTPSPAAKEWLFRFRRTASLSTAQSVSQPVISAGCSDEVRGLGIGLGLLSFCLSGLIGVRIDVVGTGPCDEADGDERRRGEAT